MGVRMSDEKDVGMISDGINAAASLAKAVPIYDDALQPLMKETGKALGTVGKVVNTMLAPVRGVVWGAEQVEEWLSNKVTKKLESEPIENIQTPDLTIAWPTIEALKFSGHKDELNEMFASLLASAMTKDKSQSTHPSFVDKIRHMSTLDAVLFKDLSKRVATTTIKISRRNKDVEGMTMLFPYVRPEFIQLAKKVGMPVNKIYPSIQSSLENLDRMGLISLNKDGHLTSKENLAEYDRIIAGPAVKAFVDSSREGVFDVIAEKSYVLLTEVGKNFAEVVFS
jgi:hypothetical protein